MKNNIFETILALQSPKTDRGKNIRDGIFTACATSVLVLLEQIDLINFGEIDMLISAIITGYLIPHINRYSRKK